MGGIECRRCLDTGRRPTGTLDAPAPRRAMSKVQ